MSNAARTTFPMPSANDQIAPAAKAAANGPVVLTEDGTPAFVLMTHDEYLRLKDRPRSILDAIADMRPEADFDFDPPRYRGPARATPIDLE
ncbi:type II toxin-antitoxin system Phd/YefM family antitoxin [Aureimonas psammosilenae]|jgi:antitoxin (DNA-binding transcriptional repressor) of toxin-antitoxin stability system|uniref:type II toxin-antitoxin system Phd/YefM family antitoxin n=1 Tax=Aureimonas psammosilenae TaxID=2495496 RepID=UPI001F3DCD33|nr:type II toxin-antitoxin system Phd/YefM family antitoxin [Aureimonas psammosilenae]